MLNWRGTMGKVKLSEWLWRFLAGVMLFAVAWSLWIFYQLNPPLLVTNAAFEAAAKARSKAQHNTQGVIAHPPGDGPAGPAATPAPVAPVPNPAPVPVEPREPPINPDKLKFTDSLSVPAQK